MSKTSQAWDKHAIKAAVYRKGRTLKQLSLESGLGPTFCSDALLAPFPKADRVIADFLGVPLHVLWPDRYDCDGNRTYSRVRRLSDSHTPSTVKKTPVSRHTRGAA